jgi:hypothetical protein
MKVQVRWMASMEGTMNIKSVIDIPDDVDDQKRYVEEHFTTQQLLASKVDDELDEITKIGDDDPKIHWCDVEEL